MNFRHLWSLRQTVFPSKEQVVDEANTLNANQLWIQIEAGNFWGVRGVAVIEQDEVLRSPRPGRGKLVIDAQHGIQLVLSAPPGKCVLIHGPLPIINIQIACL